MEDRGWRIEDRDPLSSILILLKNPMNASTRLSMNGKSPMISTAPPFVLRFSKDERLHPRSSILNRVKTDWAEGDN